ncbi:MAG: hypothetical protein HRJ53_07480 [Acidobacteria bacterium Pan2503]|uniref:Uncharacterized protein n=1 Tax=Candidatus Acidiferrum panamense TaxID=2741543 RepID=A0A7V8NNX8_9BACT|nr:hypothetical protein [Candidatus Acidoferrum panamensis]
MMDTQAQSLSVELHVLVMKIRDVCIQFLEVTRARYGDVINEDEVLELHRLFRAVERLDERASQLEARWKARQKGKV